MKTKLLFLIITVLALFSCEKDELANPEPLLASINVVNGAVDQPSVLVNNYGTTIDYSKLTNDLYFQSSTSFGVPSGKLPFEVVSGDGTDKLLYQDNLDLKPSKMYSLFIAGNTSKRDNFLFEETTVPRYKDSLVGVRVINLSSDGPAINVTTVNAPDKVEFSNVTYGKKSDFKSFTLDAQTQSNGLGFEIRDAATNEVLTAYYLDEWGWPISPSSVRFKSMTLVVCGSLSAEPYTDQYYTVFAVRNY
jgi:hypothetical protein